LAKRKENSKLLHHDKSYQQQYQASGIRALSAGRQNNQNFEDEALIPRFSSGAVVAFTPPRGSAK
jgi:hypothetical protein